MNKTTHVLLLMLTLVLTACSGAAPASNAQDGTGAGELSAPLQVAIGTLKLDGTSNAVSADQAKKLLPLWETLQVLESSDTAATQEKEALVKQIQETMTQEQTQAITALNLTRRDMGSIMQARVQTVEGTQNNGTSQSGSTSTNRSGGFGPSGGDFGGPSPDGGFGGGNPNLQGQRSQSQSGNSTSGTSSNQPASIDPNRVPTPLIQAVIEYLKTKAA